MMREKFGLKFGRLRRTMLQELGDVAVQQLAPALQSTLHDEPHEPLQVAS